MGLTEKKEGMATAYAPRQEDGQCDKNKQTKTSKEASGTGNDVREVGIGWGSSFRTLKKMVRLNFTL